MVSVQFFVFLAQVVTISLRLLARKLVGVQAKPQTSQVLPFQPFPKAYGQAPYHFTFALHHAFVLFQLDLLTHKLVARNQKSLMPLSLTLVTAQVLESLVLPLIIVPAL